MNQTLLILAAVFAGIAAHAQGSTATPRADDLREVLAQRPATGQGATRALSSEERAQLRRQVMQFSKAPGKGS